MAPEKITKKEAQETGADPVPAGNVEDKNNPHAYAEGFSQPTTSTSSSSPIEAAVTEALPVDEGDPIDIPLYEQRDLKNERVIKEGEPDLNSVSNDHSDETGNRYPLSASALESQAVQAEGVAKQLKRELERAEEAAKDARSRADEARAKEESKNESKEEAKV